jgi:hypothetical protein
MRTRSGPFRRRLRLPADLHVRLFALLAGPRPALSHCLRGRLHPRHRGRFALRASDRGGGGGGGVERGGGEGGVEPRGLLGSLLGGMSGSVGARRLQERLSAFHRSAGEPVVT